MRTRITELLGIEYPIIQGGMAWVAEYHLAAAVSNAGGLGLIGTASAPVLDLVAIITQYYRNVNNKIQKTEIAMEYRYRNTPQKPANIKTLRRTVQCYGRRESRV